MVEVTPSGSGGPLLPVPPAPDGFLKIHGGIGGVRFQFEELLAGAAELEALADEVEAVGLESARVEQELRPHQFDPRDTGVAALNAVYDARLQVDAVLHELRNIGRQVRASHRDYEGAESQTAASLALGGNRYVLPPGQIADFGLTGFLNRDTAETISGYLPLTLGLLFGVSPSFFAVQIAVSFAAGRPLPAVGTLVRSIANGPVPMLKPRPVKAISESITGAHVDTSPAGLLARAGAVDAAGQGKIEVINVGEGGKSSFIVIIPGTESDGPTGGINPFDEAGIVEGLGYRSEHISEAIRSALSQAGAEADAQVVAVGYSQGGIHAMNLSQDKAFLAEYDLKYVLTAGSPVGSITPEPGVSTLHLEHRQDWVPGTDGTPSPDTKDRVTVTLTNRVMTASGAEAGMGPGHKLSNYEDGARKVSASDNQSLLASTAALAGVVGAGGMAKVTRFQLERTPKVPERKPTVSVLPEVGLLRGR